MVLVSGVTRQPLKVSTLTSPPQSTSTIARYTSPLLPVRRWTITAFAVMVPRDDALLVLCPPSRAVEDAVRGRTDTGFHADEEEEDNSARK